MNRSVAIHHHESASPPPAQNLSADEQRIVEVAHALYTRLPLQGACYQYSFFLHYYLKKRYGIQGSVEVGFIRNAINGCYASHAWYVYRGQITDLAVSRPYNPEHNAPGALIMLGQIITPGALWHYHPEKAPEAVRALRNLLEIPSDDPNDIVSYAKHIHIKTSNAAKSMIGIRAYLDEAPRGMTYRDLVTLVEQVPTAAPIAAPNTLSYLLSSNVV
ncbi:MAG: hypothetical protein ACKVOE_03560 [Rickettsiales bacterium]